MQSQSKLTRNRSWSPEEDDTLCRQINATTGKLNWEIVAKESGLKRSANSCRLRWINHLKPGTRPDRKLTDEEKLLILVFRSEVGKNRWSKIAKLLLPGRRDNDVKNFWHSLAKGAKREGRDVHTHAFLKRVELVETIKAAGKFTMDYSSIPPFAFRKLKELLPDLPVAGGGAVAGVAAGSSSITTGAVSSASDLDLASYSAATDTGAGDAVTSCYSVESGSGRVEYGEFSNIGATAEVDQVILQEQFLEGRLGYNPEQLLKSGLVDHGGGLTDFNQVQATAFITETSNQGRSQMQVTSWDSVPVWNTFVDAPQLHTPAEQHQQLRFNSENLYDGGGPVEFNQATAAAFHNITQLHFY